MKNRIGYIALVTAAVTMSVAFAQTSAPSPSPAPGTMHDHGRGHGPRGMAMGHGGPDSAQLDKTMRKLWQDHMLYTRNYIISALGNVADTQAVTRRLMQNQEEIGDSIKPYYGDEAATKLTTLLKKHIELAAQVVQAARSSDPSNLQGTQQQWSANGKEIADFLAAANPNWQQAEMEKMMQTHLDLLTQEVTARLKQDWDADIRAEDENHKHMLMFADTLAQGIAKQFPDKVRDQVAQMNAQTNG